MTKIPGTQSPIDLLRKAISEAESQKPVPGTTFCPTLEQLSIVLKEKPKEGHRKAQFEAVANHVRICLQCQERLKVLESTVKTK